MEERNIQETDRHLYLASPWPQPLKCIAHASKDKNRCGSSLLRDDILPLRDTHRPDTRYRKSKKEGYTHKRALSLVAMISLKGHDPVAWLEMSQTACLIAQGEPWIKATLQS